MAFQYELTRRFTAEFKQEALTLADAVGVSEAATTLGIATSQLYNWRLKSNADSAKSHVDASQSAEIARLKRELAEKDMEIAILKKASAYFAKNLG